MPASERARASRRAAAALLVHPRLAACRCVALYASIGSELDTEPLWAGLQARQLTVVFPRCTAGRLLEFAPATDPMDFVPGPMGTREPVAAALPLSRLDLVVLPGLAFDKTGSRLGYGAGYYDRTLADFRGATVGLCFARQLLEVLPFAAHDRRVELVCTDTQVLAAAPALGRPA